MSEFISALSNPSVPFIRYALIAGLLASISFGITGTYVVVKRISYIAGAISHAVLSGIGASLFFQSRGVLPWFTPLFGALISALAAATIIGMVSLKGREREDTIIGTIWAVGMGIGLLFISQTEGYVDPMSYLFGNILLIGRGELLVILVLDLVAAGLGILFYPQFQSVAFDPEFAEVRGIHPGAFYLLLVLLISLTVVLMVTIVGVVMVIALLTIPAAAAGLVTKRLWSMMIAASLFCMGFTSLGLGVSYALDVPTGSATIILAGGIYFLLRGLLFLMKQLRKGKN